VPRSETSAATQGWLAAIQSKNGEGTGCGGLARTSSRSGGSGPSL